MKIAYCINSLNNPGGMERVLTTKINYLSEHFGHEIHVITMCNQEKPFFLLSKKIILHNMALTSRFKHREKLEKLLFEIRPDITVSMYGPEFTFLYKIKDGSKKIVEFHFSKNYLIHLVNGIQHLHFRLLHKLKVWFLQKKEEHYVPKYDKIILLTHQDLEFWGNKPNMCYIHNPLSFRSKESSILENKCIIAVGRYIAQKGFDILIDAYKPIAKEFPDWQLIIFGEGQDEKLLANKIKLYQLENQVILHPPTQNIQKKMLESSIFVFPSRYEGFGLVLTEAMECGLPCIAFDCECGPSEIILHNKSGFLIPNYDIFQLTTAMKKLMGDTMARKKMGQNGKRLVSKFYTEHIMEQWDKLFQELFIQYH